MRDFEPDSIADDLFGAMTPQGSKADTEETVPGSPRASPLPSPAASPQPSPVNTNEQPSDRFIEMVESEIRDTLSKKKQELISRDPLRVTQLTKSQQDQKTKMDQMKKDIEKGMCQKEIQ